MKVHKKNKSVIGFLNGKLSLTEEMQLLQWVKEDVQNKNFFLQQQALFENEPINSEDKQSTESWKRLHAKIASTFDKKLVIRIQNTKLQRILAVAAAFVFGIIISSAIISYWPVSDNSIALQNVTTPYGARTQFQLPDGSTVWLNSGSKLSYPIRFAKNRHITLEGEAFFEVQKGCPFIVSTNFGDVQVKGTSFNVKAFVNEPFETTLVTGLVQINERKTGKNILLQPDFQAKETGNKLAISKVDTDLFTSWKDGKLIFKNENLPTIARKMERWYNVHIQLDDDPRLAKINFSGTIEMESFSEVMELLKTTASINYTFNEMTRIISITKK
jgi:ferric-dicitrate binding protein FerR (iron transport regulator)